jgi:YVTN family beta-propeller protein
MSRVRGVNVSRREFGKPFVLVLLALAAPTGCGGRTSDAPATQSAQPIPSGPRVYVSDEPGGRVVIVDPAAGTVVGSLPVGKRPRGIRVLSDGQHLLVALSGSPIAGPGVDESKLPPGDRTADGIGLVDLRAMTVVRVLKSGQDPEAFALSPDEKTVYVSNEETAELSAVDVASGDVRAHVAVGEEPEGVAVRPDGQVVYVTSEGDGAVIAIDTASMKEVGRVKTGARPRGVIFTPDGARAFVTCENAGVVTVVDAQAHTWSSTITLPRIPGAPIPPRPMGLVLSPDARTLYVTDGRAQTISVIDVATLAVTRTFDNIGARPWGIGISPDGKMLYTANGSSADVSLVDAATGKVLRKIAVGGSPWGISVSRPH